MPQFNSVDLFASLNNGGLHLNEYNSIPKPLQKCTQIPTENLLLKKPPSVMTGTIKGNDPSLKIDGDFSIKNWKFIATENELKLFNNDKFIFNFNTENFNTEKSKIPDENFKSANIPVGSADNPPEYTDSTENDLLYKEVEVLYTLPTYSKLRRINNRICLENRNVFFRTLSKDSRNLILEDIKRIISLVKNNDDLLKKVFTGLAILTSTTYKNDKLWNENVDKMIKNAKKIPLRISRNGDTLLNTYLHIDLPNIKQRS